MNDDDPILFNKLTILQFGCGGTGSWLVHPLVKFLSNINMRLNNFDCRYYLIDDDFVDLRNINRQNFTEDHIHRNKSETLKFENDYLYKDCLSSLPIRIQTQKQISDLFNNYYKNKPIKPSIIFNKKIIIGCVDNNKSRRLIFNYIKKNPQKQIIYIDSGNNLYNGQIVTTIFNETLKEQLNGSNYQNINFLKYFTNKKTTNDDQSCSFFGEQSQSINMMASTLIFSIIQKLLIEEVLPPNKIEFNNGGYSTFKI